MDMKWASVAIMISCCMGLATAAQMPLKGSQLLSQAKVTPMQARAIALHKEHGAIVDQELEREAHRLRYSFDVKVGGVVHEVGVDAITGQIIEDSVDNGKD